ncbi:MAG: zf-HC2 domain-containing protein [Verrucomicrobia bacterium]|nr:zf-HC2 domain-containing protein [Verrucomicrobiota bacterium]MBI3866943.1 zf-HC2 domain-containing protein [Verrucomicrobiota bacterium]
MNTCRDYRQSIALLASGDLDPIASREVEGHLSRCPSCRGYFEELRGLCAAHETAARHLPAAAAPPALYRSVSRRIRRAGESTDTGWIRVLRARALGVAGAAALTAVCALVFLRAPERPLSMSGVPWREDSSTGLAGFSSARRLARLASTSSTEELDALLAVEGARSFAPTPAYLLGQSRRMSEVSDARSGE